MTSRIDVIGTNGNDGDHYGEEGRVEPKTHKGQEPGRIAGAPGRGPTMADLYPKYYKDVRKLDVVDVYRVHRLFGVTDNEIHHASKKLLLCGVRTGGKPARKEIEEARDTLNRWLEIQDEDEKEGRDK
jgi:hypothetical protein